MAGGLFRPSVHMSPNQEPTTPPPTFRAIDLIRLMRPQQYVKNVFVFLPLFFAQKLLEPDFLPQVILAFAAFCLLASSIYLFNDLQDIEADRLHPVKRRRPLASGAVSQGVARTVWPLLAGVGLLLLWPLGEESLLLGLAYLLLNLLYSLKMKHVAIVDIFSIAVGFELRIFAGGAAASVAPSHWLVLMTFLVALFLALAKRRDDLVLAEAGTGELRPSLDGYSFEFINAAMVVMSAVSLVCYILFTLSAKATVYYGSSHLYLTTVWAIAGFLRYLQVTLVTGGSGSPTKLLLTDRFLQVVILLWFGSFYLLLYVAPR